MCPDESRTTYRSGSGLYDLFDLVFKMGRRGDPRLALPEAVGSEARRVLDVCTGTGTSAAAIAAGHPACEVVGIDRSDEMLAVARRKLGERGIENVALVHADADDMPFEDATFDAVTISFALHEFEPELRGRALDEIARVLKPGGRLCVVDFARRASGGDRAFFALWTLTEPSTFRPFLELDWPSYGAAHGFELQDESEHSFSKLRVFERRAPGARRSTE